MEGSLDTEPMSAGELKARLYQTFRERGLVESLKSQLRTKLVTELRHSATLQQIKFAPSPSAVISSSSSLDGSSSLMLRAANSLVADHLRRCNYDYSMAVFLPESGSAEDKIFTVPDLLDLLRIVPSSQLYKKLANDLPKYDSKGFLWQLLSVLSAGRAMSQEHVGVQVDSLPALQSSIERKLQSVDEAYKQRSDEDEMMNKHAIQERLLKLKREIEARSREEINREISRFKESELKRVELEEREKARKEIASTRREIENTYKARLDALKDREHATMDRLQKHQELIERETYAQRQSLLEELRVIKQRETDIRRESEINSRAARMEEDKRKALEENLKLREASVANIETTYENRLREESKRFELDYEARVAKRLSELEQREAKMRAEQRGMDDDRETMKSMKEQLQGKARHILELENLLKDAKSEVSSAVNRSDFMNEKMRTMVDYPSLKEDNTILKRDLEHAKMRLAELGSDFKAEQSRHEELIKQLSEKMSRPSPEMQALRSELQQAREQLSHEKATVQHMEGQWKARLQEETDSNRDLRHRLSEQTNEMASLMRQLADLKLALRQTQTALNNNIYHPNRTLGLGIDNNMQNSTLADDIYMDTTLHRTNVDPELLLADNVRYQARLDDCGVDSESSRGGDSIVFIEQTKARFRQLEREAEHLEHNYQDLQHRMSGFGGNYRSPGPTMTTYPSSETAGHIDVPLSRNPDRSTRPPVDGSRPVQRGSLQQSSPASKHPKRHSASSRKSSKAGKQSQEKSGNKKESTTISHHAERRTSEKDPLSDSSSSSTVSISLRLRTSDLEGPNRRDEPMWMSQGVPSGMNGEQRTGSDVSQLSDHALPRISGEDEQRRTRENEEAQRRAEEERRQRDEEMRQREETERRREEADRRKREEEEEEERRRREGGRIDVDEEERRKRMEEEEEEQRAWEEKRQKKEEERRKKEQEAREREQRMLMELQKRETSGGASQGAPEPTAGSSGSQHEGEKGKKEEEEKEKGDDGSIKIDPVMQRYMMMVQQRKQQQETSQGAPEPQVIPDSPSVKSDGTFSAGEIEGDLGGEMEAEMEEERGMEDPASTGKVSDNDDPFGDW